MKKYLSLALSIVMILSMILLATSCNNNHVAENDTTTRTVVDMSGKEIEIPNTIDRYCVLYASAINVCAMLDENCAHMNGLVKGWMDWTYRIYPELENKAQIFDKNNVTAEEIIASGAQVVFWSNSAHESLIEPLANAGIACVYVPISDIESLKQVVTIVADVFGTDYAKNMANKYITACDEMISNVNSLTTNIAVEEAQSVLVLRDSSSLTAYGKNHFEGFWATAAHMNYIAGTDDPDGKANLTLEQICEWDPDVIIFEIPADLEALQADPTWSSLSAFKNNKVYNNPSCMNSWAAAGVEYMLQYEWAITTFYPEFATELNMEQDIIKFYNDFFGYNMNEQEVAWILAAQMPQ